MPGMECPLELYSGLVRGLTDYVWEPGVPLECYQCFHNLGVVVSEKFYEVEDIVEYGEEPNGFFFFGMKATGVYHRFAAQDGGLDDGVGDEGPMTSRTIYEFDCPFPNQLKYSDD